LLSSSLVLEIFASLIVLRLSIASTLAANHSKVCDYKSLEVITPNNRRQPWAIQVSQLKAP
jgi:hypothetical protein